MSQVAPEAVEMPTSPVLLDANAPESVARELGSKVAGGLFVRVAILCSAVAFLDGFDSTSISVAAPLIARQFHILPTQLGVIFSSAVLGATLGAFSFGRLADRFGRKRMLTAATLVFGLFTLATAFSASFASLLAFRFLAGIGLGGATPCFVALATEFAPVARRERVTTLIWTAFPLGTVIGTFISAYLVSVSGWQSIFLVGGIAPLVMVVALALWLPESVLFLQLRRFGSMQGGPVPARIGMRTLFAGGDATQTLLLWFAFWTVFGTVLAVFAFAPTIMHDHGVPLSRAGVALGLSGIGSLIGSAFAGLLIERVGPKVVLVTTLVFGGLATAFLGYAPDSLATTATILAATGLLVSGIGGAGLLAFAAVIYPTATRSTGVGAAMGLGRFGQVSMPLAVSLIVGAGFAYGEAFVVLGLLVALGGVAILLLRPRDRKHAVPPLPCA